MFDSAGIFLLFILTKSSKIKQAFNRYMPETLALQVRTCNQNRPAVT